MKRAQELIQNDKIKLPRIEESKRCSMQNSSKWLNDDCMVELFKRIGTNELICLGQLCAHCLHLIKTRIFPHRSIDVGQLISRHNAREMLTNFGPHISHLSIHRSHVQNPMHSKSSSEELLEILTNNCHTDVLKQLNISLNFNDIDPSYITSFSVKLQNIDSLKITGSHFNSSRRKLNNIENNHQINNLLRNVVRLKSISVAMMPISGKFLCQTSLDHITELILVQCDQIQSSALIKCAVHLKRLTKFAWKNCKFMGVSSISETIETVCDILGHGFKTLTDVVVHMNYNVKYCHAKDSSVLNGLTRLPQLARLSIGLAGACACNNFYANIQQLNQLQTLAIESPLVFAGHNCLPCTRVISNYLPKIFIHLRSLTSLRLVRVNPHNDNEWFFNQITANLAQIHELHLIGWYNINTDQLLTLIRDASKLKLLNLQETKFQFTIEFYTKLLNECQQNNRLIKIVIGQPTKSLLSAKLAKHYRKEFVQILDWSIIS